VFGVEGIAIDGSDLQARVAESRCQGRQGGIENLWIDVTNEAREGPAHDKETCGDIAGGG
jgi:hypothetical protein